MARVNILPKITLDYFLSLHLATKQRKSALYPNVQCNDAISKYAEEKKIIANKKTKRKHKIVKFIF